MKRVYIDGYNVINAWSDLKDLDLGAARDKLVEYMINYASFYGAKVTIVFDAHRVSGNSQHKEYRAPVEVVYTKDKETADAYIERAVDELGRKVEVLVVTSDNLEQQIIFGRGAQRMSSMEFRASFEVAAKHISEKAEALSDRKSMKLFEHMDEESREKLEKIRRNG
jgi:predicted RNA-binding protein with PIN domain